MIINRTKRVETIIQVTSPLSTTGSSKVATGFSAASPSVAVAAGAVPAAASGVATGAGAAIGAGAWGVCAPASPAVASPVPASARAASPARSQPFHAGRATRALSAMLSIRSTPLARAAPRP